VTVEDTPLLRARDLVRRFTVKSEHRGSRGDQLVAVDHVTLEVREGETLGIVGESGCGKSTLGRCLARLIDPSSGSVEFMGRDITHHSRRQLRTVRRDLQMVFQDPYDSLNPRRTVGDIVAEPMFVHKTGTSTQIRASVARLLETVGLNESQRNRYPHEFSGGQRQRIGIARALALHPKLVIADEPVSALDVSIQAQILNLFADLQEEFALTYVFIAHDLGVIRHMSDRIAVMYLGEVVEIADATILYDNPAHPYTTALLSAVPEIDDGTSAPREQIILRGDVPNPINKPSGCPFQTRCPIARDRCRNEKPVLRVLDPQTSVACHFPHQLVLGGISRAPSV
jgi:oligopeptide/dipeptide ABC transporter ATP-binding protein